MTDLTEIIKFNLMFTAILVNALLIRELLKWPKNYIINLH